MSILAYKLARLGAAAGGGTNEFARYANRAAFPVVGETDTLYFDEAIGSLWWWNGTGYLAYGFTTDIAGNATGLLAPNGAIHATLGSEIITVGNGGKHARLKEALDYIAAQSGMTQIPGFTGTVTATQFSDEVTGSGTNFVSVLPGDMIKVAGDGDGFAISGNVYHKIITVRSATTLIMQEGFVGASGAAKAYEIWRPNRFCLMLVDEVDMANFTADINLPLGATIDIQGVGYSPLIANAPSTYTIRYPRCGSFTASSIDLQVVTGSTVFDLNGVGEAVPAIASGFASIIIEDVKIQAQKSWNGNPFVLKGGYAHIHNVNGKTLGGIMNLQVDGCNIDNFICESGNANADILVLVNPNNAAFGTKKMYVSNLRMNRKLAFSTGAGAQLEIQSLTANKKVYVRNIVVTDENQPSTNPKCVVLSGNSTAKVYIEGAVIDNVGSGGGLQVSDVTAFTRNVHRGDGTAIASALVGTGVITAY